MLAELYVLSGKDTGRVHDAGVGPTIFMGRAATNHLRIRDPQASRVHCRINVSTDRLTLQDLGSGNGTYLNDDRLGPDARLLADGDEIRIGDTRMKILIETAEDRARDWVSSPSSTGGPLDDSEIAPRVGAGSRSRPTGDAEAPAPPSKERSPMREVVPGFHLQTRLGGHSREGIAVYRAVQRSLDRQVALKVFLPKTSAPEDSQRFVREAKAIARLPHPNIVAIHDLIARGKMKVIVMEYLGGGSVGDRLEHGQPLPVADILDVGRAIGTALAYLHTQGVLHRGVRPSNVLVDREHGTYKLGGFWLATGPAGERQGDTCFLEGPLESYSFLAPEQLTQSPDEVDARADVYALGATLYACAAARPPFRGNSTAVLAARVMRDDPPRLERVPPELGAVIARAMRKGPKARYPDMAGFLEELRACGASLGEAADAR